MFMNILCKYDMAQGSNRFNLDRYLDLDTDPEIFGNIAGELLVVMSMILHPYEARGKEGQ